MAGHVPRNCRSEAGGPNGSKRLKADLCRRVLGRRGCAESGRPPHDDPTDALDRFGHWGAASFDISWVVAELERHNSELVLSCRIYVSDCSAVMVWKARWSGGNCRR